MSLPSLTRLSQIRPTEFISAKKLLVDANQPIYGPSHQVNFSRIHRNQYGTISLGPNAPHAPPILSDSFEFEDDPFVDDFNNRHIDNEFTELIVDDATVNSQQTAIPTLFSEEVPLTRDELFLLENQRPWKIFPPTEEAQDSEEEWQGFSDDDFPAPNLDILPPPIESYYSREIALQSVQKWAQEHRYALRTRSSKRRQKQDPHPYLIYLECDRRGRNRPSSRRRSTAV
jgi:hypothetical protein